MKPSLSDGEHTVRDGPAKLDRAVRSHWEGASWNQVRNAIRSGKVSVDGVVVRDETHAVDSGAVIALTMAAPRHPPAPKLDDAFVFVDEHVVVVRKPHVIASVPDARHRRGTLVQLVARHLKQRGELGVVQRLDIGTSGLIVFGRHDEATLGLKEQFRAREVERDYLAIAAGRVKATTIRSYLTEHKDGKRSSTRHKHLGKYACTHVAVEKHLAGATIIRCRLDTGRTHQIRIHLSEAGHPLLGDKRYARRHIDTPPAPRLMLHAATLAFVHPVEQTKMRYSEPMPQDMMATAQACSV